jgi:hypothetical protein
MKRFIAVLAFVLPIAAQAAWFDEQLDLTDGQGATAYSGSDASQE